MSIDKEKYFEEVNSKIADFFMYLLVIFSSLGLAILTYRLSFLGLNPMNLFEVVFLSTAIIVFFFRKNMSTYLKLIIINFFVFIVLTVDVYNLGVVSSAFQYFIIIPIIFSLVEDFRRTMIYVVLISLVMGIFSYLFMNNIFSMLEEYDLFINSYPAWMLQIMGFVCVSIGSSYMISIYKKELDKKVDELNELKNQISKEN